MARFHKIAILAGALAIATPIAHADGDAAPSVSDIAHAWARATYATPDSGKVDAYDNALAEARTVAAANPRQADPLVWEAIVLASAAKANGGLTALHMAKESRDLLVSAEAIDPNAMDGSIYTTLGSLYAKVPGWPLGFGDKKKARDFFQKALSINPDGIDSNYFYGDFLADQGEYALAARYLGRALAAPPRPGREDADAGRRREAQTLLASIKEKHADALASN